MCVARLTGKQLSHDVLEQYRFRAIELRKKGWQVNKIAEAFGVNRRAVTRWLAIHRRYGKKLLKSKKAPGPTPKLTAAEVRRILSLLKNTPDMYGFEVPLWTCRTLQQLILEKLNKHLDISTIWRWLISWGLTNQVPDRRALEVDEREVKHWLKEKWPKIKVHAQRWQAMLYFQDEAGVSLIPVLGKTWAPKGKTPVLKVTGNRGSFCVSSAVSPAGRMVFRIEKKTVNAHTFIDFLKQIMRQHPYRKIIVIVDRAPVHRARCVQHFVEQNKKRFALYYLPPYAPELNPDEEVWNHLKNNKLKAHQAKTKKDFKPLIFAKMKSLQMSPALIKSFFFIYGL